MLSSNNIKEYLNITFHFSTDICFKPAAAPQQPSKKPDPGSGVVKKILVPDPGIIYTHTRRIN